MAKVTMELKVRMPKSNEYEALAQWFERQPECVRDRFQSEWEELEAAGAQLADAGFCYGIFHCWVSDDYRQHCRKFGFEWPDT